MSQKISNPYPIRIALLQKCFCQWNVDGIVICNINNIRYLTGFTGSDGALVIGCEKKVLLVDGRYTVQAAMECPGIFVVQYQDKHEGLVNVIRELAIRRLGIESAFMSIQMYRRLTRSLRRGKMVLLDDELGAIRSRKDAREVSIMKKAAAIALAAMMQLVREASAGWTEKEFAFALEYAAREAGADAMAFDPIVASGKNAALPHAKPSRRKIKKGDILVVDFGIRYRGYCSDETCTFAFGELTDPQKNAYRLVKRAHDEAIHMIRDGVPAADVDACVRRVFGDPYGQYFVHGTGHGVGLDVHEAPKLSPRSTDILRAGMVVTVEPGLYFPGQWGIRIEDTVVVKEKGCEVITKMNKELTIIE
jgi:Xaa-Pro aminopeptidase/Xaa-Pro dipeptidase